MTFKDTIFDLEEIIKNNRGGSIDPTLKNGTWYYIDLPFPVTLERMRVSAYSTLSTSGFVYGLSDLFLRYHANNNDYVIADILDLPTTYTDYEFTIPLTASGQGDIDRITTGHFAEHKSDVYHKNRIYYISHDGTECGHRNGDCDFGIHAKRAMVVGMKPIDLQYGEKRETHTDLQVNSAQGTLAFTRSYRQEEQDNPDADVRMGLGWHHNHLLFLVDKLGTINEIHVYMPTGSYARFTTALDDQLQPIADTYDALAGGTSRIVVDSGSTSARYTLTTTNQTYTYDAAGKLTKRVWSNGEERIYSYYTAGYATGLLESVADGYGHELRFAYINNSPGVDHLQLWRVGDQTASNLDTGTPSGRYVEYAYSENKEEDTGNPGTIINGGQPLLTSITDVRGNTWQYAYEQSDLDTLNFMVRYTSPAVDVDGDGTADSAITVKELSYVRSGGAMQSITQKFGKQGSGAFLEEEAYVFQANGENKTTVTKEGRITTHRFNAAGYEGTEDPDGNAGSQFMMNQYRPSQQTDAKGNLTVMTWSADGKRLEGVTDSNDNATNFSYDSQDRLIASTDAEGRITNYVYNASRREPGQIIVADTQLSELAINGGMEASSDWSDLGTPSTNEHSTEQIADGTYAWKVVANQDDGMQSAASISFAQNKTYLITARVYVVNGGDSVQMGVAGSSDWDVTSVADGAWEILRAVHTPTSALSGALQFKVTSTSATFYVDSVHVLEVEEARRWQQFIYDDKGRTLGEYRLDGADGSELQAMERSYGTSGTSNGLLETMTQKNVDAAGVDETTTTYYYDAQGRVIKTAKSSLMGTCQYTYTLHDAAGNVLGTACALVDVTPPTTLTLLKGLYDATDNTKKHTRVTTHVYDTLGRKVSTTSNDGATFARTNLTFYDALGRVIRTVQNYNAQGSSAPGTWVYRAVSGEYAWRLSNTDDTVVSHGSDLDENIISDTDYNARGLMYRRRDVLGRVSLMGYDLADRMVKTINNASQPDYDASYASGDPDLSAYVASSDVDLDMITEQVYDPNGNVVKSVDMRGSVTFTVLDALNRPVMVIRNAAQASYDILNDLDLSGYGAYSTDPDKDMVNTTEYDKMGRVIRTQRLMENRGASEVWETALTGYDSLGRQVKRIQYASIPDYDIASDPDLSDYTESTDSDQDV
ncbi:MAG: DUF6531 domain-containing protein, partial [Chloroflexota bacterium]